MSKDEITSFGIRKEAIDMILGILEKPLKKDEIIACLCLLVCQSCQHFDFPPEYLLRMILDSWDECKKNDR